VRTSPATTDRPSRQPLAGGPRPGGAPGLAIVELDVESPTARTLLAHAVAYLEACYQAAGGFAPLDPAAFAPPRGAFLVARRGREAIGCGGLRDVPGERGSCELKRIWVEPEHRRRGVATALVAALERRAATLGYRRVVLSTGARQEAAVACYVAAGYERIPGDLRYGGEVVTFEKRLVPSASPPAGRGSRGA